MEEARQQDLTRERSELSGPVLWAKGLFNWQDITKSLSELLRDRKEGNDMRNDKTPVISGDCSR
jgi:hypothetical protein